MPRRKKSSAPPTFHRPSPERQAERLLPKLERLKQVFEEGRLRMEATDLVPEQVLVLETVGRVEDFIGAVRAVPGMKWLDEIELEDIPPDDDFFDATADGQPRKAKSLRGRAYIVFTNRDGQEELISIWKKRHTLPSGLRKWRLLFECLHDVRYWGVPDRLHETGVLDDWQERIQYGDDVVPCEIELWCPSRESEQQRTARRKHVVELVERRNGRLISSAYIEDIAYHALLVELPADQVRLLLEGERDIDLIHCEQIQFFRATGQMSVAVEDDFRDHDQDVLLDDPPTGLPVIALLDGLPLQAHRRLQDRLVVDDPDAFESDYPANARQHGTAMASLILHGDLAAHEAPLSRPLYVRPILLQNPLAWRKHEETVPSGTLIVDLIHRAVRRLFVGDKGEGPVAPQIKVINLSIGIKDRPFHLVMSPLARLIDWLAWRYEVLFVVSAGNYSHEITLVPPAQTGQLLANDRQDQVLRSVAADTRHRRLLSPAESINALTVAAVHEDSSAGTPPPEYADPYHIPGLPSPINAQGMGHRRGIKPDLLAPGGRIALRPSIKGTGNLEVHVGTQPPGQQVASPGATPGVQDAKRHSRGTSNAAALVSRACCQLYDVVDELSREPGGKIIHSIPHSVWLKTLVAHGATWGEAGSVLTQVLKNKDNSRRFKEYLTRLLGYGTVDVSRVRECTARRVTALSGGTLVQDKSFVHKLPLPPSLSGQGGCRRLIVTLAWLSPMNHRHQARRKAELWFDPPKEPLQVRRKEANWQAVRRGTLQHEVLEGKKADVFVDGESLTIQVSCRAGAGTLGEEIPYALAITLEVADEIGIDIYEEIRAEVHGIRVRPTADA